MPIFSKVLGSYNLNKRHRANNGTDWNFQNGLQFWLRANIKNKFEDWSKNTLSVTHQGPGQFNIKNGPKTRFPIKSLDFTSKYASVSQDVYPGQGQTFIYSTWLYLDSLEANGANIFATDKFLDIYVDSYYKLNIRHKDSSGNFYTVKTNEDVFGIGAWHHIVVRIEPFTGGDAVQYDFKSKVSVFRNGKKLTINTTVFNDSGHPKHEENQLHPINIIGYGKGENATGSDIYLDGKLADTAVYLLDTTAKSAIYKIRLGGLDNNDANVGEDGTSNPLGVSNGPTVIWSTDDRVQGAGKFFFQIHFSVLGNGGTPSAFSSGEANIFNVPNIPRFPAVNLEIDRNEDDTWNLIATRLRNCLNSLTTSAVGGVQLTGWTVSSVGGTNGNRFFTLQSPVPTRNEPSYIYDLRIETATADWLTHGANGLVGDELTKGCNGAAGAVSDNGIRSLFEVAYNGQRTLTSGFVNLSPRLLLREKDKHDFHPTIARNSSDGRTGNFSTFFDDSKASDPAVASNVSYPTLLPIESPLIASITSSYVDGGLELPAAAQNAQTYSYNEFYRRDDTPAIEPFVDSRVYFEPGQDFYEKGTAESVLPGFSGSLRSKIALTWDLTPSAPTTFGTGFSSGSFSDPATNHPDSKVSTMVYWNNATRKWEKTGNRGGDPSTGDPSQGPGFNCTHPGSASLADREYAAKHDYDIGFSPSMGVEINAHDPEVRRAVFKSLARPTTTFGFPSHPKFAATDGQAISMSDKITGPFLAEKFIFKVKVRSQTGTKGSWHTQLGSIFSRFAYMAYIPSGGGNPTPGQSYVQSHAAVNPGPLFTGHFSKAINFFMLRQSPAPVYFDATFNESASYDREHNNVKIDAQKSSYSLQLSSQVDTAPGQKPLVTLYWASGNGAANGETLSLQINGAIYKITFATVSNASSATSWTNGTPLTATVGLNVADNASAYDVAGKVADLFNAIPGIDASRNVIMINPTVSVTTSEIPTSRNHGVIPGSPTNASGITVTPAQSAFPRIPTSLSGSASRSLATYGTLMAFADSSLSNYYADKAITTEQGSWLPWDGNTDPNTPGPRPFSAPALTGSARHGDLEETIKNNWVASEFKGFRDEGFSRDINIVFSGSEGATNHPDTSGTWTDFTSQLHLSGTFKTTPKMTGLGKVQFQSQNGMGTSTNFQEFSSYAVNVSNAGGRDPTVFSDGASLRASVPSDIPLKKSHTFMNSFVYTLSIPFPGAGWSEVQFGTKFTEESPMIFYPEDKIVFGLQDALPSIWNTSEAHNSGLIYANWGSSLLTIEKEPAEVIIYGSYISDEKPKLNHSLNQNLGSHVVKESIGSEPVLDQWETAARGSFTGSMSDDVFIGTKTGPLYGTITDGSTEPINPTSSPFSSNLDRKLGGRAVLGTQGISGSLNRNIRLVDNERWYDSIMPSVNDMIQKDVDFPDYPWKLNADARGDFNSKQRLGIGSHTNGEYLQWHNTRWLFPFENRYAGVKRGSSLALDEGTVSLSRKSIYAVNNAANNSIYGTANGQFAYIRSANSNGTIEIQQGVQAAHEAPTIRFDLLNADVNNLDGTQMTFTINYGSGLEESSETYTVNFAAVGGSDSTAFNNRIANIYHDGETALQVLTTLKTIVVANETGTASNLNNSNLFYYSSIIPNDAGTGHYFIIGAVDKTPQDSLDRNRTDGETVSPGDVFSFAGTATQGGNKFSVTVDNNRENRASDPFSPQTKYGNYEMDEAEFNSLVFGIGDEHRGAFSAFQPAVTFKGITEFNTDYYSPRMQMVYIRGVKYGLANYRPNYGSCVFRRTSYGQLRDMLEPRLYTATWENGFITPVIEARFYKRDGMPQHYRERTTCSNLSTNVTSSLPFFDRDNDSEPLNRDSLQSATIDIDANFSTGRGPFISP